MSVEHAAKPPLFILVLISAVGPLAINLFVPSMPSIASDFGAQFAVIQLGLSLYLVFTAITQPIIGPLSDRYGRKPVLIGSFLIFLFGTALCIFSQSVALFLIGRVIQTASSAGIALSRAIVRDVYPREKSASILGYVVMAMAVAPMLGPMFGGYLDEQYGWRATFILLFVSGLLALAGTIFYLPETNLHKSSNFREQVHHWRNILRMREFWIYGATMALASAVFFGFLGGGPAVANIAFHMSPFDYGLWFSVCAAGYAVGNFLSGRFAERIGIERMIVAGACIATMGTVLSLSLFLFGAYHHASLFLPLSFIGLGNGLTLPSSTAAIVSLNPAAGGAISGLASAMQIGVGAIGSVLCGIIVGESGSPIALCITLLAISLCAGVAAYLAVKIERPEYA